MSNVSKSPGLSGMSLYDASGARKYLTSEERTNFLKAAEKMERKARTLCMVLAYSGCRLSEALALSADRVDVVAGVLTFESLKKRRRGVYRAVPVPPALLDALDMVQKWLGHADLATTAIYTDAIGHEEQDIAARMWGVTSIVSL